MSDARRLGDGASTASISSSASERPIGRRSSDRVVGVSAAIQRAVDQALLASRSDRAVLVIGPAGSGRTHLARAIHAWSERARGPLEIAALGATQESLQARELFGSAASSNPQASASIEGALARAAGGTAIVRDLDQARADVRQALLRAVESGEFRAEGAGASLPLRARVIATATRASDEPAARAAFHVIEVAPLAERSEDVLPLAAHFLAEFAQQAGVAPIGFTADARSSLEKESWDGNVRELRERIRGAVRLAGNGAISAEALLLATDGEDIPSFKEAKRAFETRYVEGLLRRCSGNISRAARLAKKDRKDFYDVIRRTGVDPRAFRD
jgi:two-component system response regulator GlrR